MRRRLGGIALVAILAACSGGAGGSQEPGASQASGASQGAPASQSALPSQDASAAASTSSGSGGGGGGGGSGAPDPCALLTPSEIEAGLGAPVKDGVVDVTSDTVADCQWVGQDEFSGIEVNLRLEPYDADAWQEALTLGGSGDPTIAIPGIGETIRVGGAMYGGTYVVHVGDRTATFDATSVLLGDDASDAASRTFAELIAVRM